MIRRMFLVYGIVVCSIVVIADEPVKSSSAQKHACFGGVNCRPDGPHGPWISFNVSWDDVKDTPSWSPEGSTAPPLSAERAVAIAAPELSKYVREAKDYHVSEVSLQRYRDDEDKWIYVVRYQKQGWPADSQHHNLNMSLLILLSGKPIEGKVAP